MGDDGYWRSNVSGRVIFGHGYSKVDNFLLCEGCLNGDTLGALSSVAADPAAYATHVDQIALALQPQWKKLRLLGVNLAMCQ